MKYNAFSNLIRSDQTPLRIIGRGVVKLYLPVVDADIVRPKLAGMVERLGILGEQPALPVTAVYFTEEFGFVHAVFRSTLCSLL